MKAHLRALSLVLIIISLLTLTIGCNTSILPNASKKAIIDGPPYGAPYLSEEECKARGTAYYPNTPEYYPWLHGIEKSLAEGEIPSGRPPEGAPWLSKEQCETMGLPYYPNTPEYFPWLHK